MSWLPVLPLLVPILTSAVGLATRAGGTTHETFSAVSGAAVNLALSIWLFVAVLGHEVLVLEVGGWAAPFGITLVADRLSAVMLVAAAAVVLATVVYSVGDIGKSRRESWYFPVLFIMVTGVNGAFLTGDLFNLYVWFEVMLVGSFLLLVLGRGRAQIHGAIPYVALTMIGSLSFLSAIALLFGVTGTLNLADLSQRLPGAEQTALVSGGMIFLLVAFGLKAAVFPLFFWLPSAYPAPPAAVTAIFAGLLTKVGVYSMIRTFTLFLPALPDGFRTLILVIAGFTMVTGVFGAVTGNDFRRILSFHIVSQIGYMIMGLGFFTPFALAGAVFFTVHNMVVKTSLILVSGAVNRVRGTFLLRRLGGVAGSHPLLAGLFIVPAFSLAGMPPFTGFWGKFFLAKAGFEQSHYLLTGISLFVGLMTLYSMSKIWRYVFSAKPPEALRGRHGPPGACLTVPAAGLVILMIAMSLVPSWLFDVLHRAGAELMNPAVYREAVLAGKDGG